MRHPDYPSPSGVRHDDLKGVNMTALDYLCLVGIDHKEAKGIMDLALQSTQETISFKLQEIDIVTASILRHDLLRRVSDIRLEACKSYDVLSAQLTLVSRSERTTRPTKGHSSQMYISTVVWKRRFVRGIRF
jgi:hypothetical protein